MFLPLLVAGCLAKNIIIVKSITYHNAISNKQRYLICVYAANSTLLQVLKNLFLV